MTGGMTPEAAMAKAQANDMVQFKLKMDGLKRRLAGAPDQEARLKDACQDFEAVFITKIWEQMRSSVPKEGYLHSKEEEMYLSMFDRQFSEKMAESGGIGLGDMLFDQLKSKLRSASGDADSGASGGQGLPLRPVREGIPLERTSGTAMESPVAVPASPTGVADKTSAATGAAQVDPLMDPMRRGGGAGPAHRTGTRPAPGRHLGAGRMRRGGWNSFARFL